MHYLDQMAKYFLTRPIGKMAESFQLLRLFYTPHEVDEFVTEIWNQYHMGVAK
jgi:hypothetical protein